MPASNTRRPDPCVNWRDWDALPNEHPSFHCWRCKNGPEERLGERLYITACLLFSAIHDHCLSRQLANMYPNWSAIAAYYSMVHSLRLFWFNAYGSYPTGHRQMVDSLTRDQPGAIANWQNQILGRTRTSVRLEAFEGWLKEGLGDVGLAARREPIGQIFSLAKELRNDSNYESLVLAHQYFHHAGEMPNVVHVDVEFSLATEAMQTASETTIAFITDMMTRAFSDECAWIERRQSDQQELFETGCSPTSPQLLQLILLYVQDKINRAQEEVGTDGLFDNGLRDLQLSTLIRDATRQSAGSAIQLRSYIGYSIFGVKQNLMEGFQDKVRRLSNSVRQAAES